MPTIRPSVRRGLVDTGIVLLPEWILRVSVALGWPAVLTSFGENVRFDLPLAAPC